MLSIVSRDGASRITTSTAAGLRERISPVADPTPHCELCGQPMPAGEEMFKFHGYSGPCPTPTNNADPNAQAWEDLRADGGLPESRPVADPITPPSDPKPCELCGGSGQEVIGEHYVTRDMAIDAGEPAMEGMSAGVEWGPCSECDGAGLVTPPSDRSEP